MFQLTPNFFSTVCLGDFNPSILSINFIKNNCNYIFEGHPRSEINPVASRIVDDKISIIVEFSKFQVIREEYDDANALAVLTLASKYLTILEYTPIRALGINFHYTVSSFEQGKINLDFYNHIKDVGLKISETAELTSTLVYDKQGSIKLRGVDLRIKSLETFNFRTTVNNLKTNLSLNINFEVDGLGEYRGRIGELADRFDDITKQRDNLIKKVFEQYG